MARLFEYQFPAVLFWMGNGFPYSILSLSQIRRFSSYFSVALCDCQFPAELNGEWFSVENSIPLRLGISGSFWNEISGPKDSQASYMTCKDIFIHPPRPGQDGTQGNNMTVLMEYHK